MAVSLGKRKRSSPATIMPKTHKEPSPEESDEGDDADVRARFQRAFETRFRPLPQNTSKTGTERSSGNSDLDSNVDSQASGSEDDFDGFSDENEEIVQVIEHDIITSSIDHDVSKREMKAFMSNKPPSAIDELFASKLKSKPKNDTADDETESTNLKHDLALQRLLKESHLLDPSSTSKDSTTNILAVQGKARLKALDLRLQDLGAKKSLDSGVRMPMSHRKGITSKADSRESKRRREAAENGIILERPKAKSRSGASSARPRREKGIGAPSVGKFRGGTLTLSSKDVKSISGGGSTRGRGGKFRRK